MSAVAMTTATNLTSMLPPSECEISSAACVRSGGPCLGNLERVAIDGGDVEDFAGLARSVARDVSVPLGVAVFHARVRGALVDPGLEGRRLADVQAAHALGDEAVTIAVHPERSGDGEDHRDDRL